MKWTIETGKTPTSVRTWLVERFEERKVSNPRFSLRGYAKFLGVSPASLSQVMSGKRPLTLDMAVRIADGEELSIPERRHFLGTVAGEVAAPSQEHDDFYQISHDVFNVIADWYHFAILSLGDVADNRADPQWIATKLGITVREAEGAWNRLRRLNMIVRTGRGFRQSGKPLTTGSEVASTAIRKAYCQWVRMAMGAYHVVPKNQRDMTAITMAINPDKIPEAKDYLKRARRHLCKILEDGDQTDVYTAVFGLFPVSGGFIGD